MSPMGLEHKLVRAYGFPGNACGINAQASRELRHVAYSPGLKICTFSLENRINANKSHPIQEDC
jgi:hypothetical protein